MARFDWYQATLHDVDADHVLGELSAAFDLADVVPSTPKNGYLQGASVKRGDVVLAAVWWGGNPGVHVKITGENAPLGGQAIQAISSEARVTRVDSCEDWVLEGLFDSLADTLIDYAKANDIKINCVGDWARGKSRTLYLGARSSTAQLVVYEKGHQTGGDSRWVRLEARCYPKGDSGYRVAQWVPSQVFGASRWLTGALRAIHYDDIQHDAVGTVWKPDDSERVLRAMLRQYGKVLRKLADDSGGWSHVGEAIAAKLDVIDSEKLTKEGRGASALPIERAHA